MLELPGHGRTEAETTRRAPRRTWLWLLFSGAAVWALATGITALTRDTILVPTVILVGSFLVPVTVIACCAAAPVAPAPVNGGHRGGGCEPPPVNAARPGASRARAAMTAHTAVNAARSRGSRARAALPGEAPRSPDPLPSMRPLT